jgi:Cft2 family RNA processing exonuclease
MPPPQPVPRADVLIVESTYGNRLHPAEDAGAPGRHRRPHHRRAAASVLLPSFAVGRAQALLLLLQRLKRRGEIPTNCRSSWTARWRWRPPRSTSATPRCCACRRAR